MYLEYPNQLLESLVGMSEDTAPQPDADAYDAAGLLQIQGQEDDKQIPNPDHAEESCHEPPDLAVLEQGKPGHTGGRDGRIGPVPLDELELLRGEPSVLLRRAVEHEEANSEHQPDDAEEDEDGLPAEAEQDRS